MKTRRTHRPSAARGSPLALGWICGLLAGGALPAAEPATLPVLRIEAEMHTARINRIAVDHAGQLTLTASADKTARLWELSSGRLLRVLRPPTGAGDEGKLFACALTPDGAVAAVGGLTGRTGSGDFRVHLFDTASGRLLRQVVKIPDFLTDLAFSDDGRFLAGVIAGMNGVRVWDPSTGRELARDTEYEATGNGVDWHGNDRLATTCRDGGVRVYLFRDGALHRLICSTLEGGPEPSTARFSPDGTKIAVGFTDSTRVSVVDATDLRLLFSPRSFGVKQGDLSKVTWSDDGTTLAAAGLARAEGDCFIRRWPDAGRGKPRDQAVSADRITDLRAAPDGGVVFGGVSPSWGLLAARGRADARGVSPLPDYRDPREQFALSSDGSTVAFGFEAGGKSPARFSISTRRLDPSQEKPAFGGLRPPRTHGLEISDWKNNTAPKLAGRLLELAPNETSRCLAIAGDASSFLLGTEWGLRSFTAKGALRWTAPAPSVTWAANFAASDRLAVAAYGDGTIRWHRADNGLELLAFFPHADRQRWVLWTPEGYYDCSPGAEDLIGWHVNRGKTEAADFFSAASFRAVYYRPDVVRRVLATLGTETALREADAELGKIAPRSHSGIDSLLTETIASDRDRTFARYELAKVNAALIPPVVELTTGGVFGRVTLLAETRELWVRYTVRQTGAEPTTEVTARFNGRKVKARTESSPGSALATVVVEIPPGIAGQLAISASHRYGEGDPAILRVEREPGKTPPRKPNLYLTVVGVSDLKMNDAADRDGDGSVSAEEIDRSDLSQTHAVFADLRHAASDASRVADCYRLHEGGLFGRIVTRKLLDREATSAAIREAIAEMARQAEPEDVALLYFSGHGEIDARSGYYLATYDAEPKAVESTALTGQDLSTLLTAIKGRTVLVLDACRSGSVARGGGALPVVTSSRDLNGFVNRLTSPEQAVVVFASSDGSELSLEDPMIGGYFTQAFCEAIMGLADGAAAGQLVTCVDIQRWLRKRVPELLALLTKQDSSKTAPTPALHPPEQTPISVLPRGVPDFALVQIPSAGLDGRYQAESEAKKPKDEETEPPATPKDAIRRLLEYSRSGTAGLDPRLASCFDGQVVYEGEKLPWDDLQHLFLNHNSAYEIRAYELVGIDSEEAAEEGAVTVTYRMKVLERGKAGVPDVDTVRQMEAVLHPFEGGWFIGGLRTLPEAPAGAEVSVPQLNPRLGNTQPARRAADPARGR